MQELAPKKWVAYPPERLIGRESQQEAIRRAIQEGVRLVYIEGEAGIGKTRLLDEVDRFVGDLPYSPIVLDIVDFYDTAMHGSLALEEALARQIRQRAKEGVSTMETFLWTLERYRIEDITEDEVHTAFTQAFNGWVGGRWAVLRFDTAEFLEYGQDAPEVLEECEILGEEAPAIKWLQERLPTLERTTALVAARPTRILRRRLKEAYGEDLWMCVSLEPLSLEEAYQYFQASEYGREIEKEMVERIWLLTNGRPILLSLAIDWLARGIRVDDVYEADIGELRRLKEQRGEEWEKRRQRFEEALVSKIRLLATPMDAVVYYAARARKGFSAEMLRRMLKELSPQQIAVTSEEADELLRSLAELSFVKHPYGARLGWFFLHDEMYDLLDRHVWRFDYPAYTHQAETAKYLAEQIYGEEDGKGLIAEAARQVNRAETHTALLEALRHLDILRTEQLFYWLEANPANGYRLYDQLDTQAMSQRNREWDDMLRIELLRFMRTLPERARQGGLVKGFDLESKDVIIADHVSRDCRARWVHRFFARGDFTKAKRIAGHLLDLHSDWGGLWKARVLVSYGAALVRMGQRGSSAVLEEALKILEQPDLEGDRWMIRHYTATAYLYLGLRSRAKGNVGRAAEANEKARDFFRQNNETVGAARALNNLAYVWARRGHYAEAMRAAREAADMRRDLGDVVGTGLSLNTLAIVEDMAGSYARARTHAQEALGLLRRVQRMGRLGLDREIAMVYLNLGRIRRHLVEREMLISEELAEIMWQQADEYLKEALKREAALEPYYKFELYNQLGLLYARWANWTALRVPEKKEQYHDLMRRADEFSKQADVLGKEEGFDLARADNLEDWAWVFHLRQAYRERMGDELTPNTLEREVLERLREAEGLVRDEAKPDQEGLQAHYIAGSVHHQWGRYVHKFKGDINAALQHYALSVAYYDQFTREPVERRERVIEHIENTLNRLPAAQVRRLADEMLHAVEERGLPAHDLRRWVQDTVTSITL